MTEMTFNAAFLESLIQSTHPSSSTIYNRVCDYCGVDWNGRCVRIPAEEFLESLNPDQVKSLETFQGNLMHFFEHFDTMSNPNISNEPAAFPVFNINNSIFAKRILKDFEEKALQVFVKMTRNLVDQLRQQDRNPQKYQTGSFDAFIENLCDGDLEKTLKIVPSRALARQLGVSDQKLRREIYLARQRVLKKHSLLKEDPSNEDAESNISASDEPMLDSHDDLNIPTCASPLSSVYPDSPKKRLFDLDTEDLKQYELVDSWIEIERFTQ